SKTRPPPSPTLFPYTTLFRSRRWGRLTRPRREAQGQHHTRRCHSSKLPHPASSMRDLHAYTPERVAPRRWARRTTTSPRPSVTRSEEHTSELQSRSDLVCRLL